MRERIEVRRMHRQVRVEQVREVDTERLGGKAEELSVAVEAPGAAQLLNLKRSLVAAIEELVVDPTRLVSIRKRQRLRAMPLCGNDGHRLVRQHAKHSGAGRQLLKRHLTKPRTT